MAYIHKRMNNRRHKTFNNYVEYHKDMVYQICFSILGCPLVAEEISISVFHQAYIDLCYEESPSVQKDWLHNEIIYQVFDYFEQEKMSKKHPIDINERNNTTLSNEKLSKNEETLRNTLLSLPLTDRIFIVLRNTCSLSAKEVNKIMNKAAC
ncbi:hypothetical protein GLW00_20105 [Halobacillus litoralis]|uniref:RNA polymerase sigma factor 70 region 4 type 2 domain-containing protein n=1 Tax=Halobacillus litoralis TaxID=45668 RepID=A0A845FF93_9BACI|nr:hypothetical protein [Halobacillus litoralis]MYL73123.1 hypothetical protein [Halobacillus litoralis]